MKLFSFFTACLISSILLGSCSPDQIVLSENGYIPLKMLTHADKLVGFSDTKDLQLNTIKEIKTKQVTSYLVIKTDTENILVDHQQLFLNPKNNTWRPAAFLKTGDYLCSLQNKNIEILSIEQINTPIELLELHLESPHTFCIGHAALLAHNPAIVVIPVAIFGAEATIGAIVTAACCVTKAIISSGILKTAFYVVRDNFLKIAPLFPDKKPPATPQKKPDKKPNPEPPKKTPPPKKQTPTAPAKEKKTAAATSDWDLPKSGGKEINGRFYTEHALERMAPNTPQVRADLENRVLKRAAERGIEPATKKFGQFASKNSIDPRGIPPSVIEATIESTIPVAGKEIGTLNHCSNELMVIINESGNVVTIFPQ